MSDYTVVQEGGVAEYRLMRPESRNSLTFEMYQALEDLCRDPGDARVILLTAEGDKAFASGTDISNFKEFDSAQDAIDYEAMIGRVIDAVESSPIPVIASLHGVVAGGGAAIAASADIRLGTPDTRLVCRSRELWATVCQLPISIGWRICLASRERVICC